VFGCGRLCVFGWVLVWVWVCFVSWVGGVYRLCMCVWEWVCSVDGCVSEGVSCCGWVGVLRVWVGGFVGVGGWVEFVGVGVCVQCWYLTCRWVWVLVSHVPVGVGVGISRAGGCGCWYPTC